MEQVKGTPKTVIEWINEKRDAIASGELSKARTTTAQLHIAMLSELPETSKIWILNGGCISEILDNYFATGIVKERRSPKGKTDNTRGGWKIENKFMGEKSSCANWYYDHEEEQVIEEVLDRGSLRFDVYDGRKKVIERYQMTAKTFVELLPHFDRKEERQLRNNKTNKNLIKKHSRLLDKTIKVIF